MGIFRQLLHKAANSVSVTTPIAKAKDAFKAVDERVNNKIMPWTTGRARPQRKEALNYTDLGNRPKTVGEAFSSGIDHMRAGGELKLAPQLQEGQIAKSTVGGLVPGIRLKEYETESGEPSFWNRVWHGDFRDAANLTANKLGRQKWYEKPINAVLTGAEAASFGLGGIAKPIVAGAATSGSKGLILDKSRNPGMPEQAVATAIEAHPVNMARTLYELGSNIHRSYDPRGRRPMTGDQLRRHSFKDYVYSNPEVAKVHYPQLWQEWQAGNRW